ncbi:RNA recognition motif protein [Ceratobasidium sp. AG-Ba]|nr:RNA recognition motif protein [Ceratobasidium sp. AG-Ba]QRW02015.1 RNA recognition motif protein [Ceratobasidium sp. AG-Ba]
MNDLFATNEKSRIFMSEDKENVQHGEYVEGCSKDHELSSGEDEHLESKPDEAELDKESYDSSADELEEEGGRGMETAKPLSAGDLAEFERRQQQAGIIYISRIPPGMRPAKVKHLMSGYGKVGRVYLQQEDPKRAYLRRKHTATKKVHYTEGWVEFESKHVARSVAGMLNAQPIGGKKGTRWRDDIWTMKYLPKFKWNMLTEQVAQEAAARTARLRVELSQSRAEQRDYLKNVELARVLDKRAKRKQNPISEKEPTTQSSHTMDREERNPKKPRKQGPTSVARPGESSALGSVLSSIF